MKVMKQKLRAHYYAPDINMTGVHFTNELDGHLRNIKKELSNRGYNIPLIADIHFTPNAAEIAAKIVEKVRINPGNYVDKKRFEFYEYTEKNYKYNETKP